MTSAATHIDRFAEALSHQGDLGLAADQIGVSRPYGRVLFARIKKRLGVEQCR